MSEPRQRQQDLLRSLSHQSARLTQPSTIGGVIGVGLGVGYGSLSLKEGLDGVMLLFVFLSVFALVVLTLILETRVRKSLRTVRGVARRKVPVSRESLMTAARETMAVPDLVFRGSLFNWFAGTVFVGGCLQLFTSSVPLEASIRVVVLGVLFGPISTMLSYTLVMQRCRAGVVSLSQLGLTPEDAIEALPRRANLRGRLLIFTAIAVVTPLLLIIDVLRILSVRAYGAMLAQSGAAERAELALALRAEALWTVAGLILVTLTLALAVAWIAGAIATQPLARIRLEALSIAEGKLTRPAVIPCEDELWTVSAAFSRLQHQLMSTLGELRRAENAIGTTTEQMAGTTRRYEAGATSQASSLDQTFATTEELARSAKQIAENASSVTRIAQETLRAAQFGSESAVEFSDSIGRMHQDHTAIVESVRRLSRRIQQIGDIVQGINGVADRADLLALNAELEGAKAGDTGRNFSLVAGEMRRLAENVIESTQEIGALIEEIRGATQAAVVAAESGLGATEEGRTLARTVSARLEEIVALAGKTSDSVRTISLATHQQKAGTDQLADAMSEILGVTQSTLSATQDVTSASDGLTKLAAGLHEVVRRFDVEATKSTKATKARERSA